MDDFAPVLVMLIVFGFVTLMVRMGFKHNEKKLQLEDAIQNGHASELKNSQFVKEITELKERIAVLEKIVTADKYDLKKEFDKLDVA